MILHDFNRGWGDNIEVRRFERDIITQYLRPWADDTSRSITVNSTWYNRDYHEQVLEYINTHDVDRVALISCMDPAIVHADWFDKKDLEVRSLGYYAGRDEIDLWALIVDKYFHVDNTAVLADQLDIPFLCLNRKPHWHRLRLYDSLKNLNLLEHGIVTMGNESGQAMRELDRDVDPSTIAPNPGRDQYGIVNDIMSLGPAVIWRRCFLNVVTETIYDVDQAWFVSEKIYKPVIGLRPFIVHAPNGARTWLAHVGLENYLDDFRDISDLDLGQASNHAQFLLVLTSQPHSYFLKKYQELFPKMCHNKHKFLEHVAQIKNKIQNTISTDYVF